MVKGSWSPPFRFDKSPALSLIFLRFHRFVSRFFHNVESFTPFGVWVRRMGRSWTDIPDPIYALEVWDAERQCAVGGIVFEFYAVCRVVYIAYICIDEFYQGQGWAGALLQEFRTSRG